MGARPTVSQNLIDRFRRDGLVAVPGLLSDSEIEKFGAAVVAPFTIVAAMTAVYSPTSLDALTT